MFYLSCYEKARSPKWINWECVEEQKYGLNTGYERRAIACLKSKIRFWC
ncbi:hypothetical protein HanRHA438_Chr09g0396781 [Helianthus annuus]|nr:hypothetical protein HanRHA438_Chr09g0396781 [Helianthus annuus]KAJ0892871.1 hypothetical protein HanPSC8_Chr09g0371111 [Helianthus annuus]